jgi:predicted nucleic acid-binding protein
MSVFVDTGAWFAYFVRRDSDHNSARSWVSTNESPLVTSDYILDGASRAKPVVPKNHTHLRPRALKHFGAQAPRLRWVIRR